MRTFSSQPCAAQDQHVAETVVVVIRMHEVKPADDAGELCLFGAFDKFSFPRVLKIANLIT